MISCFFATSTELAQQLGLPKTAPLNQLKENNAIFDLNNQQLLLHLLLDSKPHQLSFDFNQGRFAFRASKASQSNEIMAKAIGCKAHYRPNVLDATAGMGRDSFIMAMLGCKVIMQERNFAIFNLLENALHRWQNSPMFEQSMVNSIRLFRNNSISSIEKLKNIENIDVIYLDPMFPERKKSALVKKEMRLFKKIAGDDIDSDQLLLVSLNSEVKRVVVKRPQTALYLANQKPSHQINSKKFRYDVYLT